MQPTVRLLYSPKIARPDVDAAFRGIKALERFGVLVEEMPISTEALKRVRLGRLLKNTCAAKVAAVLDFESPSVYLEEHVDVFLRNNILGFGLVSVPLLLKYPEGIENISGIGKNKRVALLTTFNIISQNHDIAIKIIEAKAKHEAGHIFGAPHCNFDNCVMQPAAKKAEEARARELNRIGKDFCRSCENEIQRNVDDLFLKLAA